MMFSEKKRNQDIGLGIYIYKIMNTFFYNFPRHCHYFCYFHWFSEIESSPEGPRDHPLVSLQKDEVCSCSALEYMSEEEGDQSHPQRKCTVIAFTAPNN